MEGETEKRFIGLLKEKFATPAKAGNPMKEAPKVNIPDLDLEKQSIFLKLKKLESEHQISIEQDLNKIQELKEKRDKLKKAIDILSELGLHIPEEYAGKLNSYPGEIEKLGSEIERERIYLDYLQAKIIPMF